MTHCRIGKVTPKRALNVVEMGDYSPKIDATWRWPLFEAMNRQGVKDVLVIISRDDGSEDVMEYLSNRCNTSAQMFLVERWRAAVMSRYRLV